MTFKELRAQLSKIQEQEQYKTSDDYDTLLNDCKGIPFWVDLPKEEHSKLRNECRTDRGNSTCCFWHLIGAPIKHNEEKPLFDYQHIVLNALKYFQKIRIKKFRGAGLTELFLRYPAYLFLSRNQYRNKKAFIITGITQELANDHILRLKNLFLQYYPGAVEHMDYTQKTINLNQSLFRAYPAANPEAPRGKTDVFFILADEFDHHTRRQQEDIMSVITPYRPKTDTMIVLNSTTKNPQGLYAEMDNEWTDFLKSLNMNNASINYKDLLQLQDLDYIKKMKQEIRHHYFLLEFDYFWGLNKIYTQKEIDEVKGDRTFPGESCLQYAGESGNFFNMEEINAAITSDSEYNPEIPNREAITVMGIDTGWASSYFAIVITSWVKFKVCVYYATHFKNPKANEMLNLVCDLRQKYYVDKILVDGSDVAFIYQLKERLREFPVDYHQVEKEKYQYMIVEPTTFTKQQYEFLVHDKAIMEDKAIRIHPKFSDLIIGLKSAYMEDTTFVKERSANNDLLDSLSECLSKFKPKTVNVI